MTNEEYFTSNKIPKEFWPILEDRAGAPKIITKLMNDFSTDRISNDGFEQQIWQSIALFYRNTNRLHQAIQVITSLYDQMITYQQQNDTQIHKGMPLIWTRDFHLNLGHPVNAKRYAMLTLCEDAISDKGKINVEKSGTYFRLAYEHGMPDNQIEKYFKEVYDIYNKFPKESRFPEWILQQLDKDWMIEVPTTLEVYLYNPNKQYIKYLYNSLGENTGKVLETLSDYILSIIPGIRTYSRQRSPSTDYDIVCNIDGPSIDFRSEFGRYIICECKDWSKKVDFSSIAKFCRILVSTKCRTGILFSKKGITGERNNRNAARELLKVFHDSELAILVIDSDDIRSLIEGKNLISILRKKYENVRLDLSN